MNQTAASSGKCFQSSTVNLAISAKEDLKSQMYARLPASELYTSSQLSFLEESCLGIPKEMIRIGDVGEENYLDVGRFMEDKKGEIPVYRNDPVGRTVVETLLSEPARAFFRHLMDCDYAIRRCQANVLHEGHFIGKHIDTYSNLEYKYSCVIQFGADYDGGEFFIDVNGEEREFKTEYAELLINRCEIPHGVRRVLNGRRTSIVFFLSGLALDKPNLNHNQI